MNRKFELLNKTADNTLDLKTLKMILDNSCDEIFIIDRNKSTVFVNRAAEKHYGMKVNDLIGKTADELFETGYAYPYVTPVMLKRFASEGTKIDFLQTTSIGKKIFTSAMPVYNDRGEMEFIVMNVRDITELKLAFTKLNETEGILQHKSTLVSLPKIEKQNVPEFVVQSKKMKEILELSQHIAPVNSNILIMGESGTGKSMLAKYIHEHSNRKDGPFFSINCAAIPESLLESELFGYSSGAFTGASKSGKVGLLEQADNGTLFLDEISEMSSSLQAKLLQVIQEKQFIPVGAREVRRVNARIMAASNRNLLEMVKDRKFREDLYYRLNVIEIEIPPLRDRAEDIIHLVYFFLNKFDKMYNRSHQLTKNCLEILAEYPWPGNVRELENIIERLVVTVKSVNIESCHLPKVILHNERKLQFGGSVHYNISFDSAKEEFEKNLITNAYQKFGSTRKVAKALKISQSKAFRLFRKYINTNDVDF